MAAGAVAGSRLKSFTNSQVANGGSILKVRKRLTRLSMCCALIIQLSILCAIAFRSFAQTSLQSTDLRSADAYVHREGNEWIIGTSSVERRIRLDGGHLKLVSLRNKLSGREYQDAQLLLRKSGFLLVMKM